MKRYSLISRSGLLCLLLSSPFLAASASAEPTGPVPTRIEWWREARFGIFIHWGLYSILGRGEWVQWNEQIPVDEYAKLANRFAPDKFDANEWAAVAKAAGAKYVVLTSRHHDGFALFDSKAGDFTSVKTAAHRDFVAEYTKAIRDAGLRVGLYYSPLDWRFPGYISPDLQRPSAEAMRMQYHRQVEELLSHYGKIDVLWFDGGETDWLDFGHDWGPGGTREKRPAGKHYQGTFSWQHDQVYTMLRRLQPDIVINGRADMPEDFHSREGDNALGNYDADHPWELCTTLAGAWGWQPNVEVKSLKTCVQLLVGAAGRDGNFILNVGPRADGTIEPGQVQRLREIGSWLAAHGQSIYGTRGGPYLPGNYGVSTRRGNIVYVHVLKWPEKNLRLPPLAAKVKNAALISGESIAVAQSDDGLEITVPTERRDNLDTVIALTLDRSAMELVPVSSEVR